MWIDMGLKSKIFLDMGCRSVVTRFFWILEAIDRHQTPMDGVANIVCMFHSQWLSDTNKFTDLWETRCVWKWWLLKTCYLNGQWTSILGDFSPLNPWEATKPPCRPGRRLDAASLGGMTCIGYHPLPLANQDGACALLHMFLHVSSFINICIYIYMYKWYMYILIYQIFNTISVN